MSLVKLKYNLNRKNSIKISYWCWETFWLHYWLSSIIVHFEMF